MALINTETFLTVADLIGRAAATLNTGKGEAYEQASLLSLVNKAKLAVRGGADFGMGLAPNSLESTEVVIPDVASGAMVAVPEIRVVTPFKYYSDGTPSNRIHTIAGANVTLTASVLTARRDKLRIGGDTTTVLYSPIQFYADYDAIWRKSGSALSYAVGDVYTWTGGAPILYKSVDDISTAHYPLVWGVCLKASVSAGAVAYSVVGATSTPESVGSFPPAQDDSMVLDVFSTLDKLEDTIAARTYTSELSTLISTLNTYFLKYTGSDLLTNMATSPYSTVNTDFLAVASTLLSKPITPTVATFTGPDATTNLFGPEPTNVKLLPTPKTLTVTYSGSAVTSPGSGKKTSIYVKAIAKKTGRVVSTNFGLTSIDLPIEVESGTTVDTDVTQVIPQPNNSGGVILSFITVSADDTLDDVYNIEDDYDDYGLNADAGMFGRHRPGTALYECEDIEIPIDEGKTSFTATVGSGTYYGIANAYMAGATSTGGTGFRLPADGTLTFLVK